MSLLPGACLQSKMEHSVDMTILTKQEMEHRYHPELRSLLLQSLEITMFVESLGMFP